MYLDTSRFFVFALALMVILLLFNCPKGKNDNDNNDTFTNTFGMEFVYIEPGRYDETQHQVTLSHGYYMQTTPVTQGQWETVMGDNPSQFPGRCSDCPVARVSWHDAQDFISALNDLEGTDRYALPTEAQWAYAARAGSTTAFANRILHTAYGYDPVLDAMGTYAYTSKSRTHPVAQKTPNAWGLYDMHGNVWEWVADWYGTYPSLDVTDPTGPSSGIYRVVRGGTWCSKESGRCADRVNGIPDRRSSRIGFRLVLLPDH